MGTLPTGGTLQWEIAEGAMANLQSAFTDETYENERGKAERQFRASIQAWLEAMKTTKLSDIARDNLPRLRPEEINCMGDLADSCEAFVKAELSAFVSLLKRLGMPASRAVRVLDNHRNATMQETHVQKWEYGLTKLISFPHKHPKMSRLYWSQVERDVLDFVRLDLHSLLWLPPKERGPDLRRSQERGSPQSSGKGEETLASTAVAGENKPEATNPQQSFTHSPDYRSVKLKGEGFTLTTKQAAVVQTLDENMLNGTPDVSGERLLEAAGSSGNRLRDIFKSNMEAWRALITQSRRKGVYSLNFPEVISPAVHSENSADSH